MKVNRSLESALFLNQRERTFTILMRLLILSVHALLVPVTMALTNPRKVFLDHRSCFLYGLQATSESPQHTSVSTR